MLPFKSQLHRYATSSPRPSFSGSSTSEDASQCLQRAPTPHPCPLRCARDVHTQHNPVARRGRCSRADDRRTIIGSRRLLSLIDLQSRSHASSLQCRRRGVSAIQLRRQAHLFINKVVSRRVGSGSGNHPFCLRHLHRSLVGLLIRPVPHCLQELHHVHPLGLHILHPWMLQHTPGRGATVTFLLETTQTSISLDPTCALTHLCQPCHSRQPRQASDHKNRKDNASQICPITRSSHPRPQRKRKERVVRTNTRCNT